VNGIKNQKVVFHQGIDERATRLLQADGKLLTCKADLKSAQPFVNSLGRVAENGSHVLSCLRVNETDVILGVRAIDADQRSVVSHDSPPEEKSRSGSVEHAGFSPAR